jgi:hypothetical protein
MSGSRSRIVQDRLLLDLLQGTPFEDSGRATQNAQGVPPRRLSAFHAETNYVLSRRS